MAKLPPPAGCHVIKCGGLDVFWLPSEHTLSEAELTCALHPQDLAYSTTLKSSTRHAEFLRARWLARQLVPSMNHMPTRAPTGQPLWPRETVGSITHKSGQVACTVASSTAFTGLGLDLEFSERVRVELEPKICLPEESEMLDRLVSSSTRDRRVLLALVFSFKEALFKCHFPLGLRMFYFHDAQIDSINWDRGEIVAHVLIQTSPFSPAGHQVRGAFLHGANLPMGESAVMTVALHPAG